MARHHFAVFSGILFGSTACSEPSARPAMLHPDCDGSANCAVSTPPRSWTPAAGGRDAGSETNVEVVVATYQDIDLKTATSYSGTARVTAPGISQPTVQVDASPTGTLAGVISGTEVWVTVAPTEARSRWKPTLQAIDTTLANGVGKGALTVYLFDEGFFEQVLPLLTQPILPSVGTDLGQVVVFIEDSRNDPVPGVAVSSPHAEQIAYATTDGTWSDLVTSTERPGIAVLVNVPAATSQGSLTYTRPPDAAAESAFPVAPGSVTLVRIVVS